MATPSETSRDLAQARTEYVAALDAKPLPASVEGNIRAGIANVAYHTEDYTTALQQWTAAVDKLEKEQDRVQAVYRMGTAAQRLGRWDEADKYFGIVAEMAPGQPVALVARQRQGARGFSVQVATLSDAKSAAALAAQLQKQGVPAVRAPDAGNPNLTVVRIGPLSNYTDARALKAGLAAQYPNAIILP